MKRKVWVVLALLFIIPGLLFTVSCSKKQVKSDAEVTGQPTGDEISAEEAARRRALEEERLAEQRRQQQAMAERQQFVNQDIHFDFDMATIRPDAQPILRDKAEFMRKNPNISVIIEGHCDERGTAEYNLALGERRAEAAKSFMVNAGISPQRMTTISYGEERPLDPRHTEEAWAKNRRAHFVIK